MGLRKIITLILLAGILITQSAFHPLAATFCNRAQFIADLNVPDGTSFAAGTIFTKSWRLKNIGTCTWSTAYSLVHASGETFGAPTSILLPSQVAPGQTVDLHVNMTAPSAPGLYRSFWKFSDQTGTSFGIGPNADGAFWVEINVPAASAVAFDLVAFAPYAQWKSDAGPLPYPGTSGDHRGYAQTVDFPKLEDGTVQATPGLLTVPQNKHNGYIQAIYPEFTVQKGDRFQSIVGCEFGASCYVIFHLDYITASGRVKTFWTRNEQNDRRANSVNLDLSSLAGQNVRFVLTMLATGSPVGDRAIWGSPRIVRTAVTDPPMTVTPLPFPTTLPTPTPFDTPPPVVPSGCDKAAFIADVNVPDNTLFAPGAAFTKTWRLKNIGSCTWTTEYKAVFHSGERMSASPAINLPTQVPPGGTLDLTINMVAPATNGAYRGNWVLSNPSGALFGIGSDATMPFWLQINVSGGAPINTGYDFTENLCAAQWRTAAGVLPCPGIDADIAGFAIRSDAPKLEDGSIAATPGLVVGPQFKFNGYIQGVYPAFTVQPGDRFQTSVGCEHAANCYVTFQLDYMTATGSTPTFWTWREQNEGRFYNADIDLTPLAGQSVRFILTVMATGLPFGDRAVWGSPRIARQVSNLPVTVTPPSPTITPTFTPTPTPTTTPGDDWLTFTNGAYGFQFKYPNGSQIETGGNPNFTRIRLPFQAGTNLVEKYLDVHVVEDANPCRSPVAASSIVNSSETVTINGISFLKETGGDGGVGHLHQFVAYSTLRDNDCVSLSFVLHSLNPGNFPTPPPVFDMAAESAVFGEIVSTYVWQILTQTPIPTATSTTSDWLTYTNAPYGFEFKYPPQGQITSQDTNALTMTLPFALGTNLREKYLDLRVVENANPCRSPLASTSMVTSSETVTINGISFLKETGEDGGAGHLHQWVAYSTSRDNVCVSFSFVLHSLNPGNFPTPPPVFDMVAESAVFLQIVSTFTWLAPTPVSSPTFTPTPIPTDTPTTTPTPATEVPAPITAVYAVTLVASNDVLNIRSDAGTEYPIVGWFPPDATDLMRTGPVKMVGDAQWVEVNRLDGGTGWVNFRYLTEYVSRATFCADARIPQLIEQLKQSMTQSNGDLFASMVNAKHGVAINYWRDAPPVNYTPVTARSIFTDTRVLDWGVGPAAGPVPLYGTFAQIVQPDMVGVFNSNYQLGCDDPSHAGMFVDPWPHTNIHYYSVLKPPTQDIFDWKVWLFGFEYVEGTPYLFGTVHYVWEP
jgi:hypothetical protein